VQGAGAEVESEAWSMEREGARMERGVPLEREMWIAGRGEMEDKSTSESGEMGREKWVREQWMRMTLGWGQHRPRDEQPKGGGMDGGARVEITTRDRGVGGSRDRGAWRRFREKGSGWRR